MACKADKKPMAAKKGQEPKQSMKFAKGKVRPVKTDRGTFAFKANKKGD